jgi:DNA-binding PadR family transcriptional regulator
VTGVLTQRLRHLEREALLVATPYSERPRRFQYQLTEGGRELAGALRLLADWGSRGGADGEPLTHAAVNGVLRRDHDRRGQQGGNTSHRNRPKRCRADRAHFRLVSRAKSDVPNYGERVSDNS